MRVARSLLATAVTLAVLVLHRARTVMESTALGTRGEIASVRVTGELLVRAPSSSPPKASWFPPPSPPVLAPGSSQPIANLPQPHSKLSRSPLGHEFPAPPSSLTLTFGTMAVRRYVHNWLHHTAKLPSLRPYAAVALDDRLAKLCSQWHHPALLGRALLQGAGGGAPTDEAFRALDDGYVRDHTSAFKQLGYLKALSVAQLLRHGYDVLLSDADAVWLGDPWPWIGRTGIAAASDAGDLLSADVLAANDLPDLRRDGQPDSVYNTGVTFFRASPSGRAYRFAVEWANRTLHTGVIGNDQTEFNRLLRNRYVDGDYSCNRPECLAADPHHFVPLHAAYRGPGCADYSTAGERVPVEVQHYDRQNASLERLHMDVSLFNDTSRADPCTGCRWRVEPTRRDPYTDLSAVPMRLADVRWRMCDGRQRKLRRTDLRAARRVYWMWGGRVRFGLLPMDRFLQGHTFFVQRLHAQRGVEAVHAHVTYTMGVDFGKHSRLKSAGLWIEPPTSTDRGNQGDHMGAVPRNESLLRVTGLAVLLRELLDRMNLPQSVYQCDPPPTAEERERGVLHDQPSLFFHQTDGHYESAHSPRCYHPARLVTSRKVDASYDWEHAPDPAAPHVAVQLIIRYVLRNALALAYTSKRRLVLPRLWSLCERHWWQLVDCRIPGLERISMPYEAPYDLLFSLEDWQHVRGVSMIEEGAPEVTVAIGPTWGTEKNSHGQAPLPQSSQVVHGNTSPVASLWQSMRAQTLRVAPLLRHHSAGSGANPANATLDRSAQISTVGLTLAHGSTFDGVLQQVSAQHMHPVLQIDARSLLRFSWCGFDSKSRAASFNRDVLQHVFRGQYSFCGEERNPNIDAILAEAQSRHIPADSLLNKRRNCTGQPANDFNKPRVDLGPNALSFELAHDDCNSFEDGAERALLKALKLVRL